MSVHRFMKFPDGTMKKSFILENDQQHIHRISVPLEEWNNTLRVYCHKWMKNLSKGKVAPFRWGTYEKIEITQLSNERQFICNDCKKTFVCRRGFCNHKKTCKSQTTALVVQNTQDTNPLHNAVQKETRNFGKENPKWVTSDLLYGALSNLKHAIPVMMKKKHFNDNFPENKNLRIDTRRDLDHRMQVFEEGRWIIKGSKQTFYKVLVSICDILSEALEEDEELLQSFNELTSDNENDSDDEDVHIGREIRRLRNCDKFMRKINKIRPLWHKFREKISNPDQRTDLWEDLKTLLLDRQLAIEQGFS